MNISEPNLAIEELLPLKCIVVTLRCLEPTSISFFHQSALSAYLRFLSGSAADYDTLVRIATPETGRCSYSKDDLYSFVLIGLNGSDSVIDLLLKNIAGLPKSAPKDDIELSFRNNWEAASLQDFKTDNVISSLCELSEYTLQSLNDEAEIWRNTPTLRIQFVSPSRIKKGKHKRMLASGAELKGEQSFLRDAGDLFASFITSSTRNTLADLLRRRGHETSPLVDPPNLQVSNAHLFWVEATSTGLKKKPKPMGGVLGAVELTGSECLSLNWWKVLVLSQYIGVGQRCSFGLGRFVLQNDVRLQTYKQVEAEMSILSGMKDENVLIDSWRHVNSGREGSVYANDDEYINIDDPADVVDDECPLGSMLTVIDDIIAGSYSPPDLHGYLLPKKDGGVRPIAVAPVFDRVLQRALQQVMTPGLDQLMSRNSHGYRPGRSRITASADIQRAWRQGYRWVYEGDVFDFFDSVKLTLLKERLQSLYGMSDPVSAAVIAWMAADVVFEDQKIERKQGLPQGSPLSPLMANLMLDDFDSDMRDAGFLMIRYADDFVVLCKNIEEAKQSRDRARQSLEEHGFALHPVKDKMTAMDAGFRYLGYLFVNDMALDVGSQSAELASEDDGQAVSKVVSNLKRGQSWLANLGEKQAQEANSKQSLEAIVNRIVEQPVTRVGSRTSSGTFVTLTGLPAVVSTRNRQLNVYRKDRRLMALPWKSIDAVLLLGNHQITTQAMHAALACDVPVHFASSTGHYKGCLTHSRNSQHQSVWMQQILAFQNPDKALYCARAIVGSRIKHMKETLRQRKLASGIPVINGALSSYQQADSLQRLLGYEGSATREYFRKIAEILPEAFEFEGRNRRPPRDPFNVLLSIGYVQLYALTEAVLHTQGLLPWQGFYHQPRGRHAALASDLMEPFRHLIERSAISMIQRKEICADDFQTTASGACLISEEAKRAYLAYIMRTWGLKVRQRGHAEPETWMEHARAQALSLRNFVTKGEPFRPFILR